MLSKMDLVDDGEIPVYSSDTSNNGIIGYTNREAEFIVSHENPIYLVFGDHTRSLNIVFHSFNVTDNVKVLSLKDSYSVKILLYIISSWQKGVPNLGYSRHWSIAKKVLFKVPVKNGVIDFAFMENFIAELEAERIAELEAERIAELEAYLRVTGLSDYILTEEERAVLEAFRNGKISWGGVKLLDKQQVKDIEWRVFNLEKLFGKSTRGRRLRSQDRISGNLPFVTAGEANEGISDFIGNDVIVFSENTTTIDMFGSAKYRNYKYGGDDHIAVVHTENLPKYAAIYVTTAIHKVSYAGQFSYSRNFYAKDADNLNISLPSVQGKPMYDYMEVFIRAVQKLVIKDVVQYAERKVAATRAVVK